MSTKWLGVVTVLWFVDSDFEAEPRTDGQTCEERRQIGDYDWPGSVATGSLDLEIRTHRSCLRRLRFFKQN